MLKRVVSGVLCALFIFALFSVTAFSSYSDSLYSDPVITLKDNLFDYTQCLWLTQGLDVSYSQYNRGGTSDKGVNFTNANNKSILGYTDMYNIIPGYRYIISFKEWNYQDRIDCQLFVFNDNTISDGSLDNRVDPISLTFESGELTNGYNQYNYCFTAPVSQYDYNGQLSLAFDLTCYASNIYLVIKDVEIICLDQIVTKALRSIQTNVDDLPTIAQQISDYLYALLYQDNNNFGELQDNFMLFMDWWVDHNPETTVGFFYKKFGERFSIALFEMLSEALGVGVEYETDPAVSDAVSDYQELESSLMVDKSADVSSALNSGMQGIQNNNAFAWIRNTLQFTVFDNTKLAGYILFALSMGLIVLVLGRKIHL